MSCAARFSTLPYDPRDHWRTRRGARPEEVRRITIPTSRCPKRNTVNEYICSRILSRNRCIRVSAKRLICEIIIDIKMGEDSTIYDSGIHTTFIPGCAAVRGAILLTPNRQLYVCTCEFELCKFSFPSDYSFFMVLRQIFSKITLKITCCPVYRRRTLQFRVIRATLFIGYVF